MTPKKWFIFFGTILVMMSLFSVVDVIVAGLLYLIVFLVESREASIVFKWVFNLLMLGELALLIPSLYRTIKDERNEV